MLEVGVIRRPHGIKGDTYVDLMTDREDRLAVGSRLWATGAWRTVVSSKRLPQRWLVHFEGFDDRTAIVWIESPSELGIEWKAERFV